MPKATVKEKIKKTLSKVAKPSPKQKSPAIDFPTENEVITSHHYAIRISSDADSSVEVSINDGEWIGCRNGAGFWWADWHPGDNKKYTITARSKSSNGKWNQSPSRNCKVNKN